MLLEVEGLFVLGFVAEQWVDGVVVVQQVVGVAVVLVVGVVAFGPQFGC